MTGRHRIAQATMAALVILFLWLAGLLGSSVPNLHTLPTSADGLALADYHADPLAGFGLRPLTSQIYTDTYRDALGDNPATNWTWYGNGPRGALQADAGTPPAVTQTAPQLTPRPSASPPLPSPAGPSLTTPTPGPTATAYSTPTPKPTPIATATPSPTVTPTPTPTASPTPANTVIIAGGQTWNGNLNVTGKSVAIYGTVTGDVTVSGGSLTIYGTAGHDVTVTNGNATINGTVQHNLTIQTGDLFLASTSWVGLDVTVTGGTLTRQAGSYVGGSVTVH